MLQIIGRRAARPLQLAGLICALALAGCAAPNTSAPTAPPASAPAAPTAAPATSAPAPTAAPATSAPAPTAPAATSAPTAAPSAMPQPTGAASQPSQPSDSAAAAQAVLDYYAAINDKKLDAAYQLWGNGGAASGQTAEQFKQGFANTQRVDVQLGTPKPGASGVEVPVTLIAIANDPDPSKPQLVQQFQGSYTVQASAGGARLASAQIAALSGRALPPAPFGDPAELLKGYYDLINKGQLASAYTFWGQNGANSQQSFAQFAQGYANTRQATIELGRPDSQGAAGSTYVIIPAVVVATQADGSQQAFCGTYRLRRLNVPPFDQLGLRIDAATIAPTALVQPGSDQARQLLSGGCKAG